jgi:hypothetical protein
LDDYKFLSIHQQQVLGEYMRKDISWMSLIKP